MVDKRPIKREDLVRMLGREASSPDNQRVADLVSRLGMEELTPTAIPAVQLRAVYERRRARMADTHHLAPSIDRLLSGLANYRGTDVYAVPLEAGDSIAVVWLSDTCETVISALVDVAGR